MLIMPRIKGGSYLPSSLEKNVYFCLFLEKIYEVSGFILLAYTGGGGCELMSSLLLLNPLGLYKVGLWFHFHVALGICSREVCFRDWMWCNSAIFSIIRAMVC